MAAGFARLVVQLSAPTVMIVSSPLSDSLPIGWRVAHLGLALAQASLTTYNGEMPSGSMMLPASTPQLAEMGREVSSRVSSIGARSIGAADTRLTGSRSFGRRL